MIKAFIFDLDGTIIDTPTLIMNSFKHAISENTNYELTQKEITNVLGMTLNMAFKNFANDENHLNDMINSFRNYSLNNTKELNAYLNATNVIQYLREEGYLLGIVTSKSRKIVEDNLKQLKIYDAFNCIITFEDTTKHKPNPEPLYKALKQLNVDASNAIYIGDHENDIKAGNNAKMQTGLMAYSHRFEEALKEEPTYVFENFLNIKSIIK